jgi:hypothetical protein
VRALTPAWRQLCCSLQALAQYLARLQDGDGDVVGHQAPPAHDLLQLGAERRVGFGRLRSQQVSCACRCGAPRIEPGLLVAPII